MNESVGLEWEVDADVECGVAVERNVLLRKFGDSVVHCHEEVEAFRTNVDNPTEAYAVGASRKVDASAECFSGLNVGRQAEFGSCEHASEAGSVDQTEFEIAIDGESVFNTDVESSSE